MVRKIKGFERISALSEEFRLSQTFIVKEFRYYFLEAGREYCLDMLLGTDLQKSLHEIGFRFDFVQGLKVSFGGTYVQLSGLDLEDISASGWERQNWRVRDYENGRLYFTCEEISIISTS